MLPAFVGQLDGASWSLQCPQDQEREAMFSISSYEPLPKLLVSPERTAIILPYIIPYVTPFMEFRLIIAHASCDYNNTVHAEA